MTHRPGGPQSGPAGAGACLRLAHRYPPEDLYCYYSLNRRAPTLTRPAAGGPAGLADNPSIIVSKT
eukprot:437541-Hanusia_phi.AAC.1